MGQYYKGRKIGTCESMYYMRLSEAKQLGSRHAQDDDGIKFEEYLSDNVTMWRFPFPDEDGRELAKIGFTDLNHNKGFTIPAGVLEDVGHNNICVAHHSKDGHSVNIFLPCPYSSEFKDITLSSNGTVHLSYDGVGEQKLVIRFQAIRDGEEKTIFECDRCGALQRFDSADITKLKERAMEYFESYNTEGKNPSYNGNQDKYDYAMKVLERVK